jgi:3-oxoacyl-[acyl-carrier protein] reductase
MNAPHTPRVALVTGSSRGIGRAIALALAQAGMDVAVTFRERSAEAAAVAGEIRERGRRALAVQLEVSSRQSVRRAFARCLEELGGLDALVNSAGALQQKPFLSLTDEDWDRTLSVNLKGTFLCCQEGLPILLERGGGAIVNIASVGGQIGGSLAVHYAASKAGVISLTRSLARVGAPSVRVNCVAPGLIDTEMTQAEIATEAGKAKVRTLLLQRPGEALEVARAALFLATDGSSYVTGQVLNVNGGQYLG